MEEKSNNEKEENESTEKKNDKMIMKKRNRNFKFPTKLKQNLTIRLLNECFCDDLILLKKKQKTEKHSQKLEQSKEEEINDLLNEISEIGSELELFAMESRKKRMIKLIENMAEFIDEKTIDIEEITNEFLLGDTF